MAKAPKPEHALNHGHKRKPRTKRKKVGLLTEKERMTPTRWQKVIEATANGGSHREAAKAAGISVRTVDAYLISNVGAAGQLRDAKLLWNRREWPMHLLEDLLMHIALGKTVKQAAKDADIPEERLPSLYRVLLQDKAVRKLYDESRELGAEAMADSIIEISDETDNDFDEDGKANHELINRSRLRVDTRKWLMGKMVGKRYGDNKHHIHEGDINVNHAAVLSGGRKRLEELHARRNKGKATIENDSGHVVINE